MARLKDKGIVEYLKAADKLKTIYPDISFNIAGKLGVDNKTSINKKLLDDYINRKIIIIFSAILLTRQYSTNFHWMIYWGILITELINMQGTDSERIAEIPEKSPHRH